MTDAHAADKAAHNYSAARKQQAHADYLQRQTARLLTASALLHREIVALTQDGKEVLEATRSRLSALEFHAEADTKKQKQYGDPTAHLLQQISGIYSTLQANTNYYARKKLQSNDTNNR